MRFEILIPQIISQSNSELDVLANADFAPSFEHIVTAVLVVLYGLIKGQLSANSTTSTVNTRRHTHWCLSSTITASIGNEIWALI